MPNILIDHVSHHYQPPIGDPIPVIQDLTVEIPGGSSVMIRGLPASGKTTLAHILAGHLRPSQGRIWWDHRDVTALRHHQRGCQWRDRADHPLSCEHHHQVSVLDEPWGDLDHDQRWPRMRSLIKSSPHTVMWTTVDLQVPDDLWTIEIELISEGGHRIHTKSQ